MRIITAVAFLIWSALAVAQELEKGVVPFKAEGTVRSQSQIRAAPPHGPLNLFVGKQIETIEPGDKLKIIGKKTYGGFSGAHIWYQIEPSEQQNQPATHRWVYGGVEGKDPQVPIAIINE